LFISIIPKTSPKNPQQSPKNPQKNPKKSPTIPKKNQQSPKKETSPYDFNMISAISSASGPGPSPVLAAAPMAAPFPLFCFFLGVIEIMENHGGNDMLLVEIWKYDGLYHDYCYYLFLLVTH
jgi:hypothetical protein